MPVRERQPVDRDLREVVEDRDPIVRCVVLGGPISDLDEQPARPLDDQGKQVMRRDQVCVNREAEDPEAVIEMVLPDRLVPVCGPAFQQLGAPDVVDEDVDAAMFVPNPFAQPAHLFGVEMIDGDRNARAPESRDKLRGLFDRLGTVVFRPAQSSRPAGTHHGGSSLSQGGRNTTTGAARRARDDGDTLTEQFPVWHPGHCTYICTSLHRIDENAD